MSSLRILFGKIPISLDFITFHVQCQGGGINNPLSFRNSMLSAIKRLRKIPKTAFWSSLMALSQVA